MPSVKKTERNAFVMECYESGMSMNEIVWALVEAGYERISPQRVNKVIASESADGKKVLSSI